MNSSSPFPHILRKSERINFTGYDLQRPSNHHLTKHPIILDPSKLTKIIDHEFIEICKEKRYYFEIMTFFSGYKVKEVPFESSQSKKKKTSFRKWRKYSNYRLFSEIHFFEKFPKIMTSYE